jgi:hypothetical protein
MKTYILQYKKDARIKLEITAATLELAQNDLVLLNLKITDWSYAGIKEVRVREEI